MTIDAARVDEQLPLKPVVFHILLALAGEQVHGYAVIQAVRQHSRGRIRLQTGGFYRHLRKLLDEGLVIESGEAPPDDDPRRGSYYRLSDLGLAVLRAERRRMASLVASTAALEAVGDEGQA